MSYGSDSVKNHDESSFTVRWIPYADDHLFGDIDGDFVVLPHEGSGEEIPSGLG